MTKWLYASGALCGGWSRSGDQQHHQTPKLHRPLQGGGWQCPPQLPKARSPQRSLVPGDRLQWWWETCDESNSKMKYSNFPKKLHSCITSNEISKEAKFRKFRKLKKYNLKQHALTTRQTRPESFFFLGLLLETMLETMGVLFWGVLFWILFLMDLGSKKNH